MKKPFIVHPFLFAVYPVLFLFSHNTREVLLPSIILPLALCLILGAVLFMLFRLVTRDIHKGAFLAALFLIFFFSYGHIYMIVRNWRLAGIPIGWNRHLFPVWVILFVCITFFTFRTKKSFIRLTRILDLVAIVLIVLSLSNIIIYLAKTAAVNEEDLEACYLVNPPQIKCEPAPSGLPNIYYIILDEHVRNDVLKHDFGFDNARFYEQLNKRDFFIATQGNSNYFQTHLSLASSLNLQYLDTVVQSIGNAFIGAKPLRKMLKTNTVYEFLKKNGYSTVSFSSGISATEMRHSDVYMHYGFSLDEFSIMLVNTTPIPVIVKIITNQGLNRHQHRKRVLYTLDHLADTARMEQRVFVFAHILCPHDPYIFDENGNMQSSHIQFSLDNLNNDDMSKDNDMTRYVRQLQYIDKRMIHVIDEILANSKTPPIIIIQADHGYRATFRKGNHTDQDYKSSFAILNAHYLPGFDYSKLHDSISPVNTFRLIFNHYFGTEMELLEDRSFYSSFDEPYIFSDVTEKINKEYKQTTLY